MKEKRNLTFKVKEPNELMKFLIENMPKKNRNNIKSLLKNKQVLVDGAAISQFNHPLTIGQEIMITESRLSEKDMKGIKVVYEDEYLIAIEKASGILSIATNKEREKTAYNMVKNYVKTRNPLEKLFIVHRLDRETSGVMIFAKTEEMQQILQTNWQDMVLERTYVAVVEGKVEKNSDTIISYLKENSAFVTFSSEKEIEGSKKAITHYNVLKRSKGFSLVEAKIETGRKNQIRVHMQTLGHSVVGDKKYGATTNPLGRLGLHAKSIIFKHPKTGKVLSFQTGIPVKFNGMFKR
ncbi:RluA family pseudouridine synthase [Fusobacterium sp.]|uniref:RluA family pseudouridine synthase n=1 Tax=Fusobacterium sp. TaxID=68766 RepID=UPI00260DC78E|nr:RluA family pseudouridine synthase [Fusobacterium sp.]